MTPVVGFSAQPPEMRPNYAEVSSAPITSARACRPRARRLEQWNLRGVDVHVPFFSIAGHKVGATAVVLSEFVARIRRAAGPSQRAHYLQEDDNDD